MSRWYYRKLKRSPTISQTVFALIVFASFGLYLTYGKIFLVYLVLGTVLIFTPLFIIRRHKRAGITIGQTKCSRLLWAALKERGIDAVTEYSDGHKKVDLAVPSAKLYIEVDGLHHSLELGQVITDLKRDSYSNQEGFRTIRIPNQAIREDLNRVADAVAQEIKNRF